MRIDVYSGKKKLRPSTSTLETQPDILVKKLQDIDLSKFLQVAIPVNKIIKEVSAKKIVENIIFLGAGNRLLGQDSSTMEKVIEDVFGRKGEKIIDMNKKAYNAGFNVVKDNKSIKLVQDISMDIDDTILMTGNHAIAYGAIKGGVKLFASYPMTPASAVMHYVEQEACNYDIIVKQTEDEIAAVHFVIGGAFAGVRSMASTSGGGFALMEEGISLAGQTETPLVISLVQRPGPATGLPTFHAQGDLDFAINAGHGEYPKINLPIVPPEYIVP